MNNEGVYGPKATITVPSRPEGSFICFTCSRLKSSNSRRGFLSLERVEGTCGWVCETQQVSWGNAVMCIWQDPTCGPKPAVASWWVTSGRLNGNYSYLLGNRIRPIGHSALHVGFQRPPRKKQKVWGWRQNAWVWSEVGNQSQGWMTFSFPSSYLCEPGL